jgi:hypothetical protein
MNSFAWLFAALAGFMIWIAQKQVERKMKIFDDAVTALLRYQNEGGNYELQNQHCKVNNLRARGPYLTDETAQLTGRSIAFVAEFFSHDVASSFAEALKSIRLEYPNTEEEGPRIVGTLSIPELNDLIHNLNHEVTISHIFRSWLCTLFTCKK